jgi:hypothetical protein
LSWEHDAEVGQKCPGESYRMGLTRQSIVGDAVPEAWANLAVASVFTFGASNRDLEFCGAASRRQQLSRTPAEPVVYRKTTAEPFDSQRFLATYWRPQAIAV